MTDTAQIDVRDAGVVPLDAVRAYLTALSNRGDGAISPVSVVAMQHALRRRAMPDLASARLKTLCGIKDAQDLGRGFYLPAPPHLVLLQNFALIVSGLPDQELERLYGCRPIPAGASRVLHDPENQSFNIPTSNLNDWLEAPESTIEWTRERLRSARFIEPHGLEGCELFQSWPVNAARWQMLTKHLLPRAGTFLLRHRGVTGQTNHYLIRVSAGGIAGMSELPHNSDEARRMQFGLRSLSNDPPRFQLITDTDNTSLLSLPRPPEGEQRLLAALGVVSEDARTGLWTVQIPNYSTSIVTARLLALGLKLQGA